MRVRAAFGVAVLASLGVLPVSTPAGAAPVQPVSADDCKRQPGVGLQTSWAMQRMDVARVSTINQGISVRTGRPVRVAVIDSGLDRTNPQMRGIDAARVVDAIPKDPGSRYLDCASHGTQVTAIIAAQRSAATPGFFGIAPRVRIIPVKITNYADKVASADVARGIDLAIAAHAQVANLSVSIGNDPAVEQAVARARRAGMLIVAAAGNDNGQVNASAQYPAKYSTRYDNVVAVAATTQQDTGAGFSDRGRYVDVAAPGDGIQTIGVNGGFLQLKGTSFATPYVTGAAALVLAANPDMTPSQLRARLEGTADPPGVTVPSEVFGYGIVNPYLAMTALHTDVATAPASSKPAPLRLGIAPPGPDRTLQHAALGAGFGLLGVAAVVVVGATVLRGRRRTGRA